MASDLKYGRVQIDKNRIPVDEPIFILRAQDKLAEPLIRFYAELARVYCGDVELCSSAILSAERFRRWPVKKMPD